MTPSLAGRATVPFCGGSSPVSSFMKVDFPGPVRSGQTVAAAVRERGRDLLEEHLRAVPHGYRMDTSWTVIVLTDTTPDWMKRKGCQRAASNDVVKRISIARRPLARSARVPVPVKWGCVITGVSEPPSGLQSLPRHWNQPS